MDMIDRWFSITVLNGITWEISNSPLKKENGAVKVSWNLHLLNRYEMNSFIYPTDR